MALLTSEIYRIQNELGFSGLTITAQPYASDGITQVFLQVVQPYMQSGELNYSSTPVSGGLSVSTTLALQNTPTKILPGDRLIVDQDLNQEAVHVQSVTLTTVTLLLTKAHVGTYPVTVEGGESLVRYYLNQCIQIASQISNASGTAGLKRVEDVEFYAQTQNQSGPIDELFKLQKYWRKELGIVCGVGNLRENQSMAGRNLESY